jgi:gamma-glutamyltranspeptidase/glutathione hydrolase
MKKPCVFIFILLLCSFASASGYRPAHGEHGMVTSIHAEASQVGVDILRSGGNAVDAAVATGFALAVVYPQAGNIGGGGFMLFRSATGEVRFLDFREKAPARATATMYQDEHGNVVPGLSTVGYKSIGVPGSVAGLVYAQRKWGKLSLTQVMAPAIKLAGDGFPLTYSDAQGLREERLAQFPESRRVFQRDGVFYKAGELFKQPELARTLERIAANPEDFYRGTLAREIADALQKGGALITREDLAAYKAVERTPIHGTYKGLDIYSAPPPSSGGIALVEILNILEPFDLRTHSLRSAQGMHLVTEAYRRAFYDRSEFLGDADFVQVPVAQLTDKKYAAKWRESIDPERATPSSALKRPPFAELDRVAELHPAFVGVEPENTTHYSVVDAEGNAVAVTTTLNDSFGSGVTATGLGFLLNDEMDDFSSKPGEPNMFGLRDGAANAIAPGKRPLSAMSPTILVRNGKLWLVLGSPGGPTIITTVANVLLHSVESGADIQQAVNAPRFHMQWMPDELRVEDKLTSPDTVLLLEKMGYKVERKGFWGDADCIAVDPKTGERLGASDARNNGKAIGY